MGDEDLHAFIDESGCHSASPKSPRHFLMSALVVREENRPKLIDVIADMRRDTGRLPGHRLHWKNIRDEDDRRLLSTRIGKLSFVRAITVVVCKAHMPPAFWLNAVHDIHLQAFALLLEHLSWLAYRHHSKLRYTLGHIPTLTPVHLYDFEDRLREEDRDKRWHGIRWESLLPGRLGYPTSCEELQLADLIVSATANALNPPPGRPTQREWLHNMLPMMVRDADLTTLTRYALRFSPARALELPEYGWVRAMEGAKFA